MRSARHRGVLKTVGASAAPAVVIAVGAFATIGCTSTRAPRAEQVRVALESSEPECRLERESRVSLSGITMAAVRTLVRLADDDEAEDIISNIRRLEVATYRPASRSACGGVDSLGRLESELGDLGWRLLVSERHETESSWVYARGGTDGDLEGLFVVTVDASEVEVVSLEGRIDRILADAIADDPSSAGEVLESTL